MKRLLSFSASVALLAACGGGGTSTPAETLPTGATVIKAVQSLRFDAKLVRSPGAILCTCNQ